MLRGCGVLFSLLFLLGSVGCNKAAVGTPSAPISPTTSAATHKVAFTNEEAAAGQGLAAKLEAEGLPEVAQLQSPVPVFWVALNAPEKARLNALLTMSRFSKAGKADWVDEDYRTVVEAGLEAEERAVRYGALRAAGGLVLEDKLDESLVQKMLALGSDPELTFGVLKAFTYEPSTPGTPLHEFRLKALTSAQPEVVWLALEGCKDKEVLEVDKATQDAIWDLLENKNPFIRGYAATTLALYDRNATSTEREEKLVMLVRQRWLSDEDGFIVGCGCRALSYLRIPESVEAIPELAKLLDDKRPANFKLKPQIAWEDGLETDFCTYATVGDMAENAIWELAVKLQAKGPELPGVTEWHFNPDEPQDPKVVAKRRVMLKKWIEGYLKASKDESTSSGVSPGADG